VNTRLAIRPGERLGQAVYVGSWPAGSPEWLAARRATMNGSEIAAVMGISPYESAFSLWHRKAGNVGDVEQDDVMYWGNRLEDVVREEFNQRNDRAFAPVGLFRHHARRWQGGGPDGIDGDELYEGKTARYDEGWGEPGSDEIPVHYRAQVLWYLDVFGYRRCHVAVLVAGSDYREYLVEASPDEAEAMRAKARAFLDTLDAGVPPPIDGHEATYEAVRELHPDIQPERVEIPAHIAVPYLQSLAAAQAATTEKRRCSALVVDAMGNAKDATYCGDVIARRQAKNTEGSIPYLVAERGIASQFATTEGSAA
jgi:putative phage-type endonuclease